MWDTGSGAKHSYIQIGTGNTAPTRNDKSIQTSAETAVEISAPSYSSGNISFSASIAITGTKDITESVMYSTYEEWVGNTNKAFVMFRDTFSPISVVNGDSVTVTYYLSLTNTSFTDTFGEILAYVWTGTGSSGSLSATGLTDITNTAQTAYVYSTAQTNVMFDTGSAGSNILLQIGTGNTAATRADYVIQTPVETAVGTSVPSYSNGNVSLSGVVTTTASRSVTEAGLYIEVKNTAGTDVQLMLWRAVFSAVAVPSGGQITVTFTVDT
ncbi:MAG: hypothetical protein HYY22_07870 [Thaumarchaeota archaeon]|nr:hypothetical protein [Nitrososphaerota archaeon]